MSATVDRRRPLFRALARRYVRRRIATRFDGLFVEGLARAQQRLTQEPLIVAANHVAWWDALLNIELDARLGADGFCLMDAHNLARLPFFAWVGAVPLDRQAPRTALAQLRAAASLLDRPGRTLWIYPQGRQRPAHLRPFGLQGGLRRLAAATDARVLPVAINYLYRQAAEPAIVVSIGEPLAVRPAVLPAALEASLRGGLARIDGFVDRGEGPFVELLRGRCVGDSARLPFGARLLARFGARRSPLLGAGEGSP